MNEDNMEPDIIQEVKPKPFISPCNLFLIIAGSLLILVSFLDMIILYAVPYQEIKKSKRKYPDYEFESPSKGLIALHFLEHISIIFCGVVLILATLPNDFYTTITFLSLAICVPLSFAIIYMLNIIFFAVNLKMIKNEDFTLSEIKDLTNLQNPINSIFVYITGQIKKGKHYKTCYSDIGIDIPIDSVRTSPDFETNGKEPDLFYLIISQKVNMSDELFLNFEKTKHFMVECEKKFEAQSVYYPKFDGRNLISNGKKIPSKLLKKTVIASIVFGVGIYSELLQKSIPIKRYNQEINAMCKPDVNYNEIITSIDCSKIGTCNTNNEMPHK